MVILFEKPDRLRHDGNPNIKRMDNSPGTLFSCAIITLVMMISLLAVMVPEGVGDDGGMKPLWTYETGDELRSSAISRDGNYIVAGSHDSKVYLFEKDGQEPVWSYRTGDYVNSLAISADGSYLAAGTEESDRTVYFFEKESSTPVWTYKTHEDSAGYGGVFTMDMSDDGQYLVVGSCNNRVYFFNTDNDEPDWTFSSSNFISRVSISGDGEYIAVGAGDSDIYLFTKDSASPVWDYSSGGPMSRAAISHDGNYLVGGSKDGYVYFFDREDSDPVWNFDANSPIWGLAISDDGTYIAAGSEDGFIYLFNKSSSEPLWSYQADDGIWSISISGDGETICAGSHDNNVYLFDRNSSDPLGVYETGDEISTVTISNDGKYIVAGSKDSTLYILQRGKLMAETSNATYLPGEMVDVEVSFHDGPANITIQVEDSDGDLYYLKSAEANETGHVTISFRLDKEVDIGEWKIYVTNDKDDSQATAVFEVLEPEVHPESPYVTLTLDVPESVNRGDELEVVFEIMNDLDVEITLTLALQLEDPDGIPILPEIAERSIPANSTKLYTLYQEIPADAVTGNYSIQGQILTELPRNGGYPVGFVDTTVKVN